MKFKKYEVSNTMWKENNQSSALFLDRDSYICKANTLQGSTKKKKKKCMHTDTHMCILKKKNK